MEKFGIKSSQEYLQQANSSILIVAQIETAEAVQNVEVIARVPGIDVLFVGPFDLGNNIGYPIENGEMHPNLVDTIMKIHKVASDNDKACGIYCTSGDQAREFAGRGFLMAS